MKYSGCSLSMSKKCFKDFFDMQALGVKISQEILKHFVLR